MIEVSKKDRRKYEAILKEELLTALGCTEPIAIAYAAAKAKETLGTIPDSIIVECSGNLIKNARAVVVPMTEDLRGIEAAAVLGAVGGNPAKELEVLTDVTGEDLTLTKQLLAQEICEVKLLDTPAKLNIRVRCKKGADSSLVEILHEHNHIVHIERNGEVLYDIPHSLEDVSESGTDRSCLSLEKIVSYGATADLSGLYEVLDKQIAYNSAIAQEGLSRPWGESVGRTLLEVYGNSVNVRARAAAAAGSDARMNGCEMPVVINSGSGNCALPGFVDSKNEEKTERNAGYLVVSHSGGGMLRQGTRKGIRRTPANRGMRAHRIVKGLDISEDVCHGMCP